jgi:hypothetical protein
MNNRDFEHNIATKLRSTKVGQIYFSHLKQYAPVRWIARRFWRYGYSFYIQICTHLSNIRNRINRKWRPLSKLSDFVLKNNIPTYKLVDPCVVETLVPIVFPAREQGHLASPHDKYVFPEIFVATINNATACGGTNMILAEGEVICHDLYDFERDYTAEEGNSRSLLDPKSKCICWWLHDENTERIPAMAAFVDACSGNYAHWITEVLPRIALFCAEDRFQGVPIAVNDGLHKKIMESLFLVVGAERKIITLPINKALAADKLYLTSVTGYVPFGRRASKLSGHSHGKFSPQALESLRDNIITYAEKAENHGWPEKIFIRRNSSARKLTNCAELEKLMISRGYVIVEPDSLTFLQQVQLFSNAKAIVGATGAAFANAIFSRPGTQVGVLMAKHKNMIYRYWYDMLTPIGIDVRYALGNIVSNNALGIHGDFAVDVNDVIDLLGALERK